MSRSLLILRPEPGGSVTALRAADMGLNARCYPLFEIVAEPWEAPRADPVEGVMLTSANAVRLAGPALADYHHLPAFAVGEATAAVARKYGFADVRVGSSDAQALVALIGSAGLRTVLHLTGRDSREVDPGALSIVPRIVYASMPVGTAEALLAEAGEDAVFMVHSPRAAERLADLIPAELHPRYSVVAISEAAAERLGAGWADVATAARPRDDALLALAARLCQ